MEKKFELTKNTIEYFGTILYQIKALKDFGDVKKGDLGGYIEKENNLSQEGSSWVSGNAKISGDAKISGNAKIWGDAEIWGYAKIWGDTRISANARISGYAKIWGDARISANAEISGNARISANARISQSHKIFFGICNADLSKNLIESIRCQTGLGVFDGKIVAYKEVNKDLSSAYDASFKYEVGKTAIAKNVEENNESCAGGLHFSNMNYWNGKIDNSVYLQAEILLEDVITAQEGKIRCRKAKILGVYDPNKK